MPRFVKLRRGEEWINETEIVSMIREPKNAVRLFFRDGASALASWGFDPETWNETVVPAAPGAFVWVFWHEDDGEVHHRKHAVVAWRVDGSVAEPVMIDQLSPNESWYLEQPDGRVDEAFSCSFESFDDALEDYRANVIRELERKAKEPA